jgi:hypothetical protein
MNDQHVKSDWSKVTDPLQSIRIIDTIEPSETQFEFEAEEILGGKTKSGGAMLYKLNADKSIVE